jgi:hypothetical protein
MIGEHIRALKDGRWVHAIDCGDETVLHLAEDAAPRRVRRAYRPEFVAGAQSVESVTHRERTFPPVEVVRRAYSRAADPTLAVMFGDSQAFAEWCTTGRMPGPRNVAVELPAPGHGRTNGVVKGPESPAKPLRSPVKARPAKAAPAAKASPGKVKARGAKAPKRTKAKATSSAARRGGRKLGRGSNPPRARRAMKRRARR